MCKFNLRCNPPGNRSAGKFGMQEPRVGVLGGGGGLPACSLPGAAELLLLGLAHRGTRDLQPTLLGCS